MIDIYSLSWFHGLYILFELFLQMFVYKQLIRLQETPDEIPAGETPHTVTLFAFDDLVDTVGCMFFYY